MWTLSQCTSSLPTPDPSRDPLVRYWPLAAPWAAARLRRSGNRGLAPMRGIVLAVLISLMTCSWASDRPFVAGDLYVEVKVSDRGYVRVYLLTGPEHSTDDWLDNRVVMVAVNSENAGEDGREALLLTTGCAPIYEDDAIGDTEEVWWMWTVACPYQGRVKFIGKYTDQVQYRSAK